MPIKAATKPARQAPATDAVRLRPEKSFQDLIFALQRFWAEQGCVVLQPYDNGELLARLERLSRNISLSESSVRVDVDAHEVRVEGELIELTRQEFALLRLFMQNRGRVFTREQILDRAWGARFGSTRTVDTHVKRLREKLGPAGQALETVRGVGYKMVEIPQNATGTSSITMR